MDRQTGTAEQRQTTRRRILYLSLALSAMLHVTLLTALVPNGLPDAPAPDITTSMEVALQADGQPSEPPDPPPTTNDDVSPASPDLPPLLPEPVRARNPIPLATLPVPEPEAQRETAAGESAPPVSRERTGPAVDSSPVTAPDPPHDIALSPLPLPAPEREMAAPVRETLNRRIDEWLQEPQRLVDRQEMVWEHEQRSYRMQLETQTVPPTRPEQAVLTIHTHRDGRPVSASVTLRRQAFSRFAKFVDRWDNDVWLSGDEVIGRFHSNSRIRVETSRRLQPVFHGPVTVAADMYLDHSMRDPDIFRSGIETGVDTVPMPRVSIDIQAIEVAASEPGQQVRFFDTDTEIEFLSRSGYRWQSDDGASGEQTGSPILYLVARDGVTLSVRGTVAGQVLVYAPRALRITGSLTYHQPPDAYPGSSDLLGLVSDGSVIVAGPDITGRGDLDIHAAIYAGRRFSVQRFRTRQNDRLTILGSLTAGSVSATEPRFSTRVVHDDRFAVLRPPLFPQTTVWTNEPVPAHWADDGAGAPPTGRQTVNRPPDTSPADPDSAVPAPAR